MTIELKPWMGQQTFLIPLEFLPASTEAKPPWLEALLNNSGEQVALRLGVTGYHLDLRQTADGWHFLSMFDPVANRMLIQADFQIKDQKLYLPHYPVRSQMASTVFAGTPHLVNLRSAKYSNAFDWYGHMVNEDQSIYNHAVKNSLNLTLIVLGQIARSRGVKGIVKEIDMTADYLYWHERHLALLRRGLEAPPPVVIGILGTKSAKKLRLAESQSGVLFLDHVEPQVAEVDTEGNPRAEEADFDFYREIQPPIQTLAQRRENIKDTAIKKGLGGIRNAFNFPICTSDTAGAILIDNQGQFSSIQHPSELTTGSRVRTIAKGVDKEIIFNLPGKILVVHNAQAMTLKIINIAIPHLRLDEAGQWVKDMAQVYREALQKLEVVVGADVQELVLKFAEDIPISILEKSYAGTSGLGIDFYPEGKLDQSLTKYVTVWIHRDSETWEKDELESDEVKAIILGFSPQLFARMWTSLYPSGYPIMIEDKIRQDRRNHTDQEKMRKIGRLRAIYTYLSHSLLPDTTLVDFGAWIGRYLHLLQLRQTQIYALDTDAEACETARNNVAAYGYGLGKVEVVQENITQTHFPDNAVDTVSALEVIEYLKPDEIELAIQEAWRIVKPEPSSQQNQLSRRPALIVSTRIKGTDQDETVEEAPGIFSEAELGELLKRYFYEVAIIYQKRDGEVTDKRVLVPGKPEKNSQFMIAVCYRKRKI